MNYFLNLYKQIYENQYMERDELHNLLDYFFKDIRDAKEYCNILILTIYIRDHTYGLGLKDISRWMLLYLYKMIPTTVSGMVGYYISCGYFRDLSLIIADLYDDGYTDNDILVNKCYNLYLYNLIDDYENYLNNNYSQLSNCIKYIPKQNSTFQKKYKMCTKLVNKLFNEYYPNINYKHSDKMKSYRKMCSSINKAIKTTEVFMSENRWNEINFAEVPKKCYMDNYRAFLNNNKDCNILNKNRNECRNNYINHMEDTDNFNIYRINYTADYIYKINDTDDYYCQYIDLLSMLRNTYYTAYNYLENYNNEIIIYKMKHDKLDNFIKKILKKDAIGNKKTTDNSITENSITENSIKLTKSLAELSINDDDGNIDTGPSVDTETHVDPEASPTIKELLTNNILKLENEDSLEITIIDDICDSDLNSINKISDEEYEIIDDFVQLDELNITQV